MRFLLIIFSIYYFVTAIFTEIVNHADWNFYSLYSLILLFSVLTLAVLGKLRDRNDQIDVQTITIWNSHIFVIPVLVLMWLLIRYDVFVQGLVWFDEATQFIPYWSLDKSVDCVKYAAMQQQMPLDYYTSYAFLKIFGASSEALLFHSRMYGLLSCLVLYVIFNQLRFHWFLILLGFCLFLSQSTILRYSSEARPIGLTIFWGLVNLYYFYDFSKNEKSNFTTGLLPSSLLLMLSTGLQPVVHIFVLTFAFKMQNTSKQKKSSFELNFLISIILASPLIWNIYQNTAGIVPQFKSQDLSSTILDLFKNINLEQFFIYFSEINQGLIHLLLFCVVLCSVFDLRNKNLNRPFAFWSYFLIFPLFFVWIWSVMDWYLNPHYYVLWVVTLIVVSLDIINMNARAAIISRSYVKAIILVVTIFVSVSFVQNEKMTLSQVKQMPDLRKLHQYERENIQSVYISMPLQHPDDNGFFLDYVGIFYDTKNRYFYSNKYENIFRNKLKNIRPDLTTVFNHVVNKQISSNIDLIVLLYCGMYVENPYCKLNLDDLKLDGVGPEVVKLNDHHRALIFKNQTNLILSLNQIYGHIETVMENSPWMLKYYQLKMWHCINLSEYSLARIYAKKILQIIDSNSFKNQFYIIDIYNEAKQYQTIAD